MSFVKLSLEVLCLESELHDLLLVLGTVATLTFLYLGFIERSHGILLFHRPAVTRIVLLVDFQLIVQLCLEIPSSIFSL